VGGDEGDVEAADEEAAREQHVARVGERLANGADGRVPRPVVDRARAAAERDGEHRNERDQTADEHEGGGRPVRADEPLAERREHELAERAHRRGQAHRPRATVLGHEPGERGDDDRERRAGEADSDQRSKFWTAMASAKVSRSQWRRSESGSAKRPKLVRAPNVMSAIRHPAAITTLRLRHHGVMPCNLPRATGAVRRLTRR
jgi:hypothetical protein